MSTITNELLPTRGAAAGPAAPKPAALGQADFMRLMTEQLKHQDPLKPLSNSEFIGQLAQFSTVQGISDLNAAVGGFGGALTGDQVLRGASLVGHSVLVPSDKLALAAAGGASGVVMAPGAGTVNFEISNASGTVVRTISVAAAGKGELPFAWNGLDANGQRLAPGAYSVKSTFVDAGGKATGVN
ncbi:MAG TPA: flagellar hook capping FlgD N-terminal domain-containing protein, partial [Pseudoxanthomonas sp.]|nr:flagellar hook capping FlgD N-terminal domain-containing protein [Pseudoxanthomonas sp.]